LVSVLLFYFGGLEPGLLNHWTGLGARPLFILGVFLIFLISIFSISLIFHWGLLFIFTLLLLFEFKFYFYPVWLRFNYFILQEILSLLFLINLTLEFQILILLFKFRVSPFYGWMISIASYMWGRLLIIFIIYYKLAISPILTIYLSRTSLVLLVGLIVLYSSIIRVSRTKSLLILFSLEGQNWLLLFLLYSLSGFWQLLFLYLFTYMVLLGGLTSGSYYTLISILLFLGAPLTSRFFIKYFFLVEASSFLGPMVLLVLLLASFSILGLMWLFFLIILTINSYYRPSRRFWVFLGVVIWLLVI